MDIWCYWDACGTGRVGLSTLITWHIKKIRKFGANLPLLGEGWTLEASWPKCQFKALTSLKKCKKDTFPLFSIYDPIHGTLDYIRTLLVLLYSLLCTRLACRPCISSCNVLNNIGLCIREMWVTKWMNGYIWNFYSASRVTPCCPELIGAKNKKGCSSGSC